MSRAVNPVVSQISQQSSNDPSNDRVPRKFINPPVFINVEISRHQSSFHDHSSKLELCKVHRIKIEKFLLFHNHHESISNRHDSIIDPDSFLALESQDDMLQSNEYKKVRSSLQAQHTLISKSSNYKPTYFCYIIRHWYVWDLFKHTFVRIHCIKQCPKIFQLLHVWMTLQLVSRVIDICLSLLFETQKTPLKRARQVNKYWATHCNCACVCSLRCLSRATWTPPTKAHKQN